MTKKREALVEELLADLTGRNADDAEYIGKKMIGRAGTESEEDEGAITGTSRCRLEGCGGTRLHVKWADGARTYPCAKGCRLREDGKYQIQ